MVVGGRGVLQKINEENPAKSWILSCKSKFTSWQVWIKDEFYVCKALKVLISEPVQQALRVKWGVFGVFVCFGLYFVNYRSWQAEILQERAEGCIQVDLQKKIRQT